MCLFTNHRVCYRQGESKDMDIIKMKSEDKEMSRPVANQDTG